MADISLDQAVAPLVITLDIGSSSARALLYDGRGRRVASVGTQEPYELTSTRDGASEDDPEAAMDRVCRCLDALLGQITPSGRPIGAVAISSMASTFLALDGEGRPLTPVISYADTRNAQDAAALRERLDERVIHERSGCLLRTSYWPARLAWLRRTRPDIWRRARGWTSLGEYLELRLFGRRRVSHSVASWGGLLNRHSLEWDAGLLDDLGISADQLAPLADVGERLEGLAQPFAARWPALAGVPWLPAIGDGAAANLGSGCVDAGRIALTVGTTGALRIVVPEVPAIPAGLWAYRVDRRAALLGGATSEGGNLYAWLHGSLRLDEESDAAMGVLPPDGHGLTMLPFIAGERSPGWAGDAKASIHGITLDTTPQEILRAAMESVAYRFGLIAEGLAGAGGEARQIIASGGALLRSPV
ncbi:gluconokinase, partial [Oscillochloris sp. ZM17-4]|uniref:gluconokinase n=1 Tax=Oscillochloris sp. ZM17-4 TaxID=2866714 RepID=UPI001C7385B2